MSVISFRPWGSYQILEASEYHWVKRLVIEPGGRTSLQSHRRRDEFWICIMGAVDAVLKDFPRTLKKGDWRVLEPGDTLCVRRGVKHRIMNNSLSDPAVLIEVATGQPREDDITRHADDYGRS